MIIELDRRRLLDARQSQVLDLRSKGLTFKEIGIGLGVSPARAKQIYDQTNSFLESPPHWMDGFSMRLKNVLHNCGIKTPDEAIIAIREGRLSPKARQGVRNYAWKSHAELCKRLGLTPPRQKSGIQKLYERKRKMASRMAKHKIKMRLWLKRFRQEEKLIDSLIRQANELKDV